MFFWQKWQKNNIHMCCRWSCSNSSRPTTPSEKTSAGVPYRWKQRISGRLYCQDPLNSIWGYWRRVAEVQHLHATPWRKRGGAPFPQFCTSRWHPKPRRPQWGGVSHQEDGQCPICRLRCCRPISAWPQPRLQPTQRRSQAQHPSALNAMSNPPWLRMQRKITGRYKVCTSRIEPKMTLLSPSTSKNACCSLRTRSKGRGIASRTAAMFHLPKSFQACIKGDSSSEDTGRDNPKVSSAPSLWCATSPQAFQEI